MGGFCGGATRPRLGLDLRLQRAHLVIVVVLPERNTTGAILLWFQRCIAGAPAEDGDHVRPPIIRSISLAGIRRRLLILK